MSGRQREEGTGFSSAGLAGTHQWWCGVCVGGVVPSSLYPLRKPCCVLSTALYKGLARQMIPAFSGMTMMLQLTVLFFHLRQSGHVVGAGLGLVVLVAVLPGMGLLACVATMWGFDFAVVGSLASSVEIVVWIFSLNLFSRLVVCGV